ncbi:hypothetical protein B0A49_09700, partial [Cryomyces minteri]
AAFQVLRDGSARTKEIAEIDSREHGPASAFQTPQANKAAADSPAEPPFRRRGKGRRMPYV